MRVQINLASEPFRRDRPILFASAACAVVLVALLGVLVFLIVSERGRQTESRTAVAKGPLAWLAEVAPALTRALSRPA